MSFCKGRKGKDIVFRLMRNLLSLFFSLWLKVSGFSFTFYKLEQYLLLLY